MVYPGGSKLLRHTPGSATGHYLLVSGSMEALRTDTLVQLYKRPLSKTPFFSFPIIVFVLVSFLLISYTPNANMADLSAGPGLVA